MDHIIITILIYFILLFYNAETSPYDFEILSQTPIDNFFCQNTQKCIVQYAFRYEYSVEQYEFSYLTAYRFLGSYIFYQKLMRRFRRVKCITNLNNSISPRATTHVHIARTNYTYAYIYTCEYEYTREVTLNLFIEQFV